MLAPLRDVGPEDDLVGRWARREPAALREVDRILTAAGLSMDVVMATAFSRNIATLQALEHLIATAEMRREHTLLLIERRRLGFGRELRRAVTQIEGNSGSDAG